MNILITGGTGTLGHAIVSRLLPTANFERICIYSRDEHKQERMLAYFKNKPGAERLRFFIGDVRDKERLRLALHNIHLVVHAAAMKIIPIAEYNPFECLKTNILGAQNLIDNVLNIQWHYRTKIVAVSTDKAVHPINLYGASKLCSEKLFLSSNNIQGPGGPMFSVVRYGNVANSNGSVIPLFQEQVKRGKQLTITDDNMTRFWITADEAVDLVFYALNIMHGGEIFVKSMPSFKVKDLAMLMMKDYKLEDRWCKFIGIRPGEKLHEDILTKFEAERSMYHPEDGIYTVRPQGVIQRTLEEGINSNSPEVKRFTYEELYINMKEIGAME